MASQTFLYEILLRFGPDGYQGGHVKDLKRFVDEEDGSVHDKELDPRPITLAECGELLGGKTAELIEQIGALQSENHALAERANAGPLAVEDEVPPVGGPPKSPDRP